VIKPRLDELLERVDSHYACVLVAAKRARQINSYYHNLGEGTFDEYPPPMVDTESKNYLKIALEEIAAGKIQYVEPSAVAAAEAEAAAAAEAAEMQEPEA
jgi:DNA-directed RNA polymerase subunit omega